MYIYTDACHVQIYATRSHHTIVVFAASDLEDNILLKMCWDMIFGGALTFAAAVLLVNKYIYIQYTWGINRKYAQAH